MTWIDDQFVVSGSRDGSVALWRVTDEMLEEVTRAEIPSYLFSRPLMKKQCKQGGNSTDILRISPKQL